MDDSRPLAVESFSDSWLSNVEHSHDATSKMMDYKIVKPSRNLDETQNFKFNTPIHPSFHTADADELFLHGSIQPVNLAHTILGASSTSDFIPEKHLTSLTSGRNRSHHLGRWRRSFVCMLQKCLGCLSPICRKVDPGEGTRAGDGNRKSCEICSQLHSPGISPQRNSGSSAGDWCHVESSIYEAILYCKRSIGK